MLETITAVNQAVNSFIWGIPAMVCIIGVGLLLSVRTGFLQLRKFPYAIKTIIGRIFRKKDASDCWVSVKQFSRNDTATACQDWLRSTRLGRGSIKSHVRTVKVLGMGLFAFQERVHLWKGVTH